MSTIIKIDTRSNAAKRFLEYVKTLSFVKIEEKEMDESDTKSPYDPEFVKMVKKSAGSKKRYTVDPKDVWGSLGLK